MTPNYEDAVNAIASVLQVDDTGSWSEKTRLETDLGMDSGLMLELIMTLEEDIPDLVIDQATLSYENFATIGSVCKFIDMATCPEPA